MKQFPHLISQLFYQPVCITQARHAAIVRVLESRLAQGNAAARAHMEGEMPDPEDKCDFKVCGSTAIIPVHGVLVRHASDIPASSCGCGLDDVEEMIDMALADKSIGTVLFNFNTPGGAVTGLREVGRKIAAITSKKTISFADDQCCSAGVWLASQCQYSFCSESASIGSIGVWCAYLDQSRRMLNEGDNVQAISAGKFKLTGAPWRTLTDEERAMIQADVDKIYGQFKEAVNLRREVAEEFMQGQVFDGERAVEIGLCDALVDNMGELLD